MADVKWIKIVTDIFDDEKILLIENMPEADSIIVIWFKLLCMAGKHNNSGVFKLNDKIPYTDEMFATIFRRNLNTVRLAMTTFESFGMIEIINNTVVIPNWGKHQSMDDSEAITKVKEQNRLRQQRHREKQRNLLLNEERNVTVTLYNAPRVTVDVNVEKKLDYINSSTVHENESYQQGYQQSDTTKTVDNFEEISFFQMYFTLKLGYEQIKAYKNQYPNVDIIKELKAAKDKIRYENMSFSHENQLKTFIDRWLENEEALIK